ncbi:hypothetical protein [Hungatella hathewayi]|uniref:hypothetical protein n=1 Tax=Hungatella hathewayi TaxID=154046 RepID=UPI0035619420
MKIKTPVGVIYDLDECELIDDGHDFSINNQNRLAEELFEQTGILIAGEKGGDG